MQVIKRLFYSACLLIPSTMYAQSALLPQGYKHQELMDRLEIRYRDSALSFQHIKPFDRKGWVAALERHMTDSLSRVDAYNLQDALMNNYEWVSGSKESFKSKRPWAKTFYQIKSDFAMVDVKDFFLTVNPVFQAQLSHESTDNIDQDFVNTKGIRGRGLIAKKIGFDFYATDNQERPPYYVRDFEDSMLAVPGAGYYKTFKKTGYDYLDARGSIFFNITKYINTQFGYDRNFIGNGYRSLFLSDFAPNYLFLKLNARIWKMNYQMLVMELSPRSSYQNGDLLIDKKYASMHHLGIQATKWLNLGLFESVIFGRTNHFDFTYLNPVILLRSVEQQNGSPDNANIGFDFKANVARKFQFYGQLLFDEFKLDEMKSGNGWWGNKYALQLGGKYIDVLGVKNLDIQGEINMVRPFTYSFRDSVANYAHYNQPLAHPRGANFVEFVGLVKYQPHPKWNIQGKLIAWEQGLDLAGQNYGSNILRSYTTRPKDYGWNFAEGRSSKTFYASLWVGYELFENLFIDASLVARKFDVPSYDKENRNFKMATIGIRMNMFRREYDY